ncbi:GDSL-type esterase/lipase family protein [Streptomyces sp. NBC_00572]|uniref:golvesin C-terminal-like domain-containing protein n=1 Tax=Streptomyces sp. NBC_00572 TaxID=2903664 RepID=UPI0022590270|nr:GDSL-type esterase/lipase family protein [Streptomyces sp. NBC_00572]MCX4981307.1 GDSL-type esterase/lipase family protein [Streptomyces sp. NBC_00572]
MRFLHTARAPLAAVAAGALLAGLTQATAWAGPGPGAPPAPVTTDTAPQQDRVPAGDRAEVLGEDWQKSADIAWTTTGDAQGFHLLTATEQSGYAWKTLASLAEPGFDVDQWIGNACVTGSGKRAVVVYAPRTFTNDTRLMARGGFTAIVDLTSGAVTKLKVNASLSYYNPGCGADEEAVLTQSPGEDKRQTRLFRVNTATGQVSEPVVVDGQITSSVPVTGGKIAAASGRTLVEIDGRGAKKKLATTGTVPYRISKDNDGGYVFMERVQRDSVKETETALVSRWAAKKVTRLGHGPLADAGLARVGGQVYLTGDVTTEASLPKSVTRLSGVHKDATLSTKGAAIVQHTVWADGVGSPKYLQRDKATDARPVKIDTTLRDTGKNVGFTVTPMAATSAKWESSRTPSPLLGTAKGAPDTAKGGVQTQTAGARALTSTTAAAATAGDAGEIVESDRTCSVPRNDPRNQAVQPKPRQVEWAVDKAVTGNLNIGASRPANWKNLGMPAYSPQSLFPNPVLDGGGRVPAQVLLGITAQESNMWQASRSAVPGVTGSPLIGNYYGVDYYDGNPANDWDVNWSKADCGYGVTQVTDHMRLAGREHDKGGAAWDYQKQRAVALDYAANVAAGLGILVEKWNQTKRAGIQVHDGNPAKLENWFFALWAYNSGFYENVNANGPWGVGWANNPANPEWDAGRLPFMETRLGGEDASAAARPQHWPYPEKVLGFAAHPPSFLESPGTLVAAFRPAWWNGTTEDATVKGSAKYNRAQMKPPEDLFCGVYNWCEPSKISDGAKNEPGAGPCTRDDFKCWFHLSVQWKTDCSYSCGNELYRFTSPDYDAEQADGTAYPPNCTRSGLPAGALVVDDLPGGTPSIRPGCANSEWSNSGTFTADFPGESGIAHDGTAATVYPGKVDMHQLGAGFGGHFYFGHTRDDTVDAKGDRLNFTGTWTLNQGRTDWMRVLVHLPDHGAHTQQARYDIDTGGGSFTRHRYVNQKRGSNGWMSLGAYQMNGVPRVQLTTETEDGTGDDDVAFDAVAFQPLPGKPQQVVQMGDSYSSGEGAGSYAKDSDNDIDDKARWNACRRSANSWARKTTLPGRSASIGTLADGFSSELEFQNVSCSGAQSFQLKTGYPVDQSGNEKWGFDGNFHERFQIDSGVLSGDTDLVTLTIGGNDAGFPTVMQDCVTLGCPAEEDVHKDIDDAMPKIESLLRDIHTAAGGAKIVLLGYPKIFNENSLTCVSGVGGAGMIRINDNAEYMEAKQRAVVDKLKAEGKPIFFESPDGDFEGRRACDSPEGINKIVTAGKGPGDFKCEVGGTWCVSRESYHPNNTGTSAYSVAFRRALDKLPK